MIMRARVTGKEWEREKQKVFDTLEGTPKPALDSPPPDLWYVGKRNCFL